MLHTAGLTYKDIIRFLRRPSDFSTGVISRTEAVSVFLSVLLLDVLLTWLIISLIGLLTSQGWITVASHRMNDVVQADMPVAFSVIVIIVTSIVLPFAEELVFRLPLRFRYNPVHVLVSVFNNENTREDAVRGLRNLWDRFYGLVFYASVFVFAGIHLFNFSLNIEIVIWSPVLLMPQMVLAALTAYLRVRWGFASGYYLHACHNMIFISSSYIIAYF